jgi:hypothetical protein
MSQHQPQVSTADERSAIRHAIESIDQRSLGERRMKERGKKEREKRIFAVLSGGDVVVQKRPPWYSRVWMVAVVGERG